MLVSYQVHMLAAVTYLVTQKVVNASDVNSCCTCAELFVR
jgi:hypothetical protein